MKLQILGSSSHGNCYLFISENSNEVLAVEAGVDFHKVQRAVDYRIGNIVGCLISHEHGDHASRVGGFEGRCIAIYASPGTVKALRKPNGASPFLRAVPPLKSIRICGFEVLPFPVQHDAAEPFGFLIRHEECGTVLFATDTYFLKYRFPGLNNILLECNYRKDLLDANLAAGHIDHRRYDRTVQSHMSYENCLRTLHANDLSEVNNIVLLHLSDDNSNEKEFVSGIAREFPDTTVTAAAPGITINLNKHPY